MSRDTATNFPGAFRVVLEYPWGTRYVGPYQTLGAAKGQLTQQTGYNSSATGWVEKTPDGQWERVE